MLLLPEEVPPWVVGKRLGAAFEIVTTPAGLLISRDAPANSHLFYFHYHLPVFYLVSSRTGQSAERSRFEGDVKRGPGNAERS